MSLGRSRKFDSILGFTYLKRIENGGRQRNGRDIRADYVHFEGHWDVTPKMPNMSQRQVVIFG